MTDLPIRRTALDELVLAAHAAREMLDEAAEYHKPAYNVAVRLDFALAELTRAGVSIDKYGDVTWPTSGITPRSGLLDAIATTADDTAVHIALMAAGVRQLAADTESPFEDRVLLADALVHAAEAAVDAHRVLGRAIRYAARGDEADDDEEA